MTEQVKTQTQQAAGQVADQAKEQAASLVATQKDRAAQSLSGVAQALRQTSQNLQEQDQGAVSQFADKAAAQVERVSGYLQERDLNQLVGEVEEYTRRRPGLVLGGAFVLGLMAARFLKTSGSGQGSQRSGYSDYRSSGYGYTTGHGYTPNPAYSTGPDQGPSGYQTVPSHSEDVPSAPYPGTGAAGGGAVRTSDGT